MNKYGNLAIENIAQVGSLKAFSLLSTEISIRGYMPL